MIRKLASMLLRSLQEELRHVRFLLRARSGEVSPNAHEANILAQFVSAGDWQLTLVRTSASAFSCRRDRSVDLGEC